MGEIFSEGVGHRVYIITPQWGGYSYFLAHAFSHDILEVVPCYVKTMLVETDSYVLYEIRLCNKAVQ